MFNNFVIKLEIMLLMAEVSGPLYRVKGVLLSRMLVLRLWSVWDLLDSA